MICLCAFVICYKLHKMLPYRDRTLSLTKIEKKQKSLFSECLILLSILDAVFINGQSVDYLFVGNIVYTVSHQHMKSLNLFYFNHAWDGQASFGTVCFVLPLCC